MNGFANLLAAAAFAALGAMAWPAILNGGFELDANADGAPDSWFRSGGAAWDRSGAESAAGLGAAKAALGHHWAQWMPAAPNQRLAVAARIRSDSPMGFARLGMQWNRGAEQIGFSSSPWLFGSAAYEARYASFLAPPESNFGLLVLRTPSPTYWTWFDEIEVFEESIANPGFELADGPLSEAWALGGEAAVDRSGLHARSGLAAAGIPSGGAIEQRFAVSPEGKNCVLAAWARSEIGSVSLRLGLDWLDEEGRAAAGPRRDVFAGAEWTRLALAFSPPEMAIAARLRVEGLSAATAWLDDFALYWTAVAPNPFSPNGDALHDEAALWFGMPEAHQVTLDILPESSLAPVRRLAERAAFSGGATAIPWDGLTDGGVRAADGAYWARFRFESASLGSLETSHSLALRTDRLYPPPFQALDFPFPFGVWGVEAYRRASSQSASPFPLLAQGGFNLAIAHNPSAPQTDRLIEDADRVGMRALLDSSAVDAEILRAGPFRGLDEERLFEEFETQAARFGASRAFAGRYLRDEPSAEQAPIVGQAARVAALADPARPAFSTLAASGDETARFAAMGLPALLFDAYPLEERSSQTPQAFAAWMAAHKRAAEAARQAAKPLWAFIQTFGAPDFHRRPTAQETRAQAYALLALGARGLLYFLLDSDPFMDGLLDARQRPTALFDAAARLNRETAPLAALLAGAAPSTDTLILERGAEDAIAAPFRDAQNRLWIALASLRTTRPLHVRLRLDGLRAAAVFDEREGEPLPFTQAEDGVRFDWILGPGDGGLARIDE